MRNEQSSRAVPETGVVEELRYSLHDQGDDAIDTRYSIFEGDEIVLLFNLPLAGHLRARDVVDAFNRADALAAKDRELAEARAAKDGAYSERNQCVALIARFALAYGCRVGIAKTAIEGWDEAWHGCVYIDLPTGQVSWHYHDSEAHLFDFLPPYLGAWDGHTTPEKYERVSATFPIRPTETERERDEAMAALREKEERVKALEDRYEDWKPVSEPPHQIQIERGEMLSFYRDDEHGTYWSGTWSQRRDADIWCRIVTAGLNERANSVLSSVQPVSGSREQRGNEEGQS